MELTELQVYINNISGCLDIVDLISAMRQYHKWNMLVKSDTIFTSQLSNIYNNFQQESDIQTRTEQYKSTTETVFLNIYLSIKKTLQVIIGQSAEKLK